MLISRSKGPKLYPFVVVSGTSVIGIRLVSTGRDTNGALTLISARRLVAISVALVGMTNEGMIRSSDVVPSIAKFFQFLKYFYEIAPSACR
jgi:hypothetical protein